MVSKMRFLKVFILLLVLGSFILIKIPKTKDITNITISYVNYNYYTKNDIEVKTINLNDNQINTIKDILININNGVLIENKPEYRQGNKEVEVGSDKGLLIITDDIYDESKFIVNFHSSSILSRLTNSIPNNSKSFKNMSINSDEFKILFEELEKLEI